MIPHIYQSVNGWFDWEDTYRRWAREIPQGGNLVEIGCYKGRSLAFLLVELLNLGRYDVTVHAVDNWAGVEGVEGQVLEDIFHSTLRRIDYPVAVHRKDSVKAAERFLPGMVDRVWIDGSHAEEDVYQDLRAWWPKVRQGGEMGGHDLSAHAGVDAAVGRWSREQGLAFEVLRSCHSDGGVMTNSWLVVKA